MQNNKCYYDIFMNSHLSALSRFESSILLRCILPLYGIRVTLLRNQTAFFSDCARESAHRVFAPFPSNVAEREPSINLEMDHPAPRSIPSRSPRLIERVDSRVPLREEDTAHVKYRCQVCGFRDGAARPSRSRGESEMRPFSGRHSHRAAGYSHAG